MNKDKTSDLTPYLVMNGIDINDLKVDESGRIYVQVEGYDNDGDPIKKEFDLPNIYQTRENVFFLENGRWANEDELPEYEIHSDSWSDVSASDS